MNETNKKLEQLSTTLTEAWQKLDLDTKLTRVAELEQLTADPDLWSNP